MKTAHIIILGGCLSVALFVFSYVFFDEIAAASTGYNSTERGFFGWKYSYAEHEFVQDGEGSTRAVLISSGDEVRYGRLAFEIVISVAIGFSIGLIMICFLSAIFFQTWLGSSISNSVCHPHHSGIISNSDPSVRQTFFRCLRRR